MIGGYEVLSSIAIFLGGLLGGAFLLTLPVWFGARGKERLSSECVPSYGVAGRVGSSRSLRAEPSARASRLRAHYQRVGANVDLSSVSDVMDLSGLGVDRDTGFDRFDKGCQLDNVESLSMYAARKRLSSLRGTSEMEGA